MKEYRLNVKLNTMDMYRFLMRHEYGSFSGLFGLAVSILAIVALAMGVGADDRNTQILIGLVALAFTVFNPIRLFLRAQKQLVTNPTFQKPITYVFSEAGLHIAQDEVEMDVVWEDMQRLVRGKKIMVLYLSKMVGYIFPKSQCDGRFEELGAAIELKLAQTRAASREEVTAETAADETIAEESSAKESSVAGKMTAEKDTVEMAAVKKDATMKKTSAMKQKRKYDMPPGEAEIWGDDEDTDNESL